MILTTLDELADLRNTVEDLDSQMIVTNGCFDLFHPGHLHLLKTAFNMSRPYSKIVVLLNSDRSIRRLKGPGRPVQDEKTRAEMLDAVRFVNDVYIFDTERCDKELYLLRPHIYIKGDDRKLKDLDRGEYAVLKLHRTKIVLLPRLKGHSTTAKITKGA